MPLDEKSSMLPPYIQRMIDEVDALNSKINSLSTFIQTNPIFQTLPKLKQQLLMAQYNSMQCYGEILKTRINVEMDEEFQSNK